MALFYVTSLYVAVGTSLTMLWTILNGLQLLVHLPLFFTPFPANAHYFSAKLVNVATFEFIPSEFLDLFFEFYPPYKEPYNLAMQTTGYSSMYAVGNLGTFFVLCNLVVFAFLLWLILYIFRNASRCA